MEDIDIEEAFAGLGPVSIRRMFGGKGVYHQNLIVAVVYQGELLLKADAVSAPLFESAGARPWEYESKSGKAARMPYWSIPDDAVDDPEVLAQWTRLAFEAALRAGK